MPSITGALIIAICFLISLRAELSTLKMCWVKSLCSESIDCLLLSAALAALRIGGLSFAWPLAVIYCVDSSLLTEITPEDLPVGATVLRIEGGLLEENSSNTIGSRIPNLARCVVISSIVSDLAFTTKL